MHSIVDTLHLRRDELGPLISRYPAAVITKTSQDVVHHVTIPCDDRSEEEYYLFLLHSGIALSSHNFCALVEKDKIFVARMRAGLEGKPAV